MIKANNVEDQTDKVRSLKHSEAIRKDVDTIQKLKCTAKRRVQKRAVINVIFTYTQIFSTS